MSRYDSNAATDYHRSSAEAEPVRVEPEAARSRREERHQAWQDRREMRELLPRSTFFNRGFALTMMLLVAGMMVFFFMYTV